MCVVAIFHFFLAAREILVFLYYCCVGEKKVIDSAFEFFFFSVRFGCWRSGYLVCFSSCVYIYIYICSGMPFIPSQTIKRRGAPVLKDEI